MYLDLFDYVLIYVVENAKNQMAGGMLYAAGPGLLRGRQCYPVNRASRPNTLPPGPLCRERIVLFPISPP
jgi:hypothetical protein